MTLDRLIHEPSRLRLVTLLYVVDEADFLYLSDRSGFSAGNISSHMAKLETAGFVDIQIKQSRRLQIPEPLLAQFLGPDSTADPRAGDLGVYSITVTGTRPAD